MGSEDRAGSRWEIGDEKNAADTVADIRYDVPPGFTEEEVHIGMVFLHEPAEEILFIVLRTNREAGNVAAAELDGVLSSFFKDLKRAGAMSRGTYNGMRGLQVRLTGTYNGQPTNVTTRMLEPQPGKFVVVVGAYLAARKEALNGTFQRFFASVKPV